MFGKYIEDRVAFNEEKNPDTWNNLTKEEGELLSWFMLEMDKRKNVIDKHGTESFGPFYYYFYMNKLYEKKLLFQIEIGNELFYTIPREMDEYFTTKRYKKITGNTYSFDMRVFLVHLLKHFNEVIHQNGDNREGNDPYHLHTVVHFLKKHDLAVLSEWVRLNPDDFFESITIHYLSHLFNRDDKDAILLFKEMLYGHSFSFYDAINTMDDQNDIVEYPFFINGKPSSCIDSLMEKRKDYDGIVRLNESEFLIPSDAPISLLWSITLFAQIKSIGQMLHVSFSNDSVQQAKKHRVPYSLWDDCLDSLKLESTSEKQSMKQYWEMAHPIVKRDVYIFYEISTKALLHQLKKEVVNEFGAHCVVEHEEGLFILESISEKWERLLKKSSLTFKERLTEEKDNSDNKVFRKVDIEPDEWQEVDRLSAVSFQLMSYKENMMARLIRQSQALKLPILIETSNKEKFIVEVKTLNFQANNANILTYKGYEMSIQQIHRLAIVHPHNQDSTTNIVKK
ncbi:hypothetical protein [Evansella cellulosilytica]|nr:hypothetical protein [Evansella cellulosilytica]